MRRLTHLWALPVPAVHAVALEVDRGVLLGEELRDQLTAAREAWRLTL